jgi:hypothetical protein
MALTGVEVSTDGGADARVSGAPDAVLLWLWRRLDDDAVRRDGDPRLIGTLRQLLGGATG